MQRTHILVFVIGLFFGIALAATIQVPEQTPAAAVESPFVYSFNSPGVLKESSSMEKSTSPYFWLNSGAYLSIKNGIGGTVQGSLPSEDSLRIAYNQNNPLDTGSGYYPQNLFRLVTRSSWGDAAQSVSFRINKIETTNTPNRDGYSGVFLMSRYKDSDNLYYAGVRDDGQAVIKKKINGTYYTLADEQIFGAENMYDKNVRPSLLPIGEWTGLKMTTENAYDGSVLVRLFLDRGNNGDWVSILSARDKGTGGAPLRSATHAGIRTDYKDVQFDTYRLENL